MIFINEEEKIALREKGITEATFTVALRLVRDWSETLYMGTELVKPGSLRMFAFQIANTITTDMNLAVSEYRERHKAVPPPPKLQWVLCPVCGRGHWHDPDVKKEA